MKREIRWRRRSVLTWRRFFWQSEGPEKCILFIKNVYLYTKPPENAVFMRTGKNKMAFRKDVELLLEGPWILLRDRGNRQIRAFRKSLANALFIWMVRAGI